MPHINIGPLFHAITSRGVLSRSTSVTPLPAALPLSGTGLGVIGFLARR